MSEYPDKGFSHKISSHPPLTDLRGNRNIYIFFYNTTNIMKIKDFINNAFGYTPKEIYQFTLPTDSENPESTTIQNSKQTPEKKENVFPNINENLEYVKTKYNTLINSDIIVREFILNARGNQYKAFLLYIDGMVDSQILNDFVLESLMLRNRNNLFNGEQNRIISESTTNNVTIRKVKKFNLADYIESCLIPQNSITQQSSFDDIFSGINSGNCALFVDTLSVCFDIDVKGFKQRSISKPENEIVVKGPHEAFVENLRTNTSLLRRFTNNENLIIENIKVGKITKTNCAVCYIQNITNDDLVVLPGDFSWAMHLEDTDMDFEYLNSMPGKKLMLKGNHDYWWGTLSKIKASTMKFLLLIYS